MNPGGSDVAVIVVRMPDPQAVRFQGILGGEDGLATLRCRHPDKTEQELWTTRVQLDELHEWLQNLPASLQVEIVRENT